MIGDTPITIRCSGLSGAPDCFRRAAAGMFRRLVKAMGYTLRSTPNGAGAAVGSAVHAGGAVMLDEKGRTGALPPASVAIDAAVGELRERVREGVLYDNLTRNLMDAEAQAARMVRVYLRDVAPQVTPLVVERRFEAVVPFTRQPMILSGQLDVLAREPGRLRDSKTGRMLGVHRAQLGGYSLLSKSQPEALQVSSSVIDFIRRVPVKSEQPAAETYVQDLAGCESAAIATLKTLDVQLTLFLEGDHERGVMPGDPAAFPANPNSRLCSDKYCPAHGADWCREHDKGVLE